MAEETIIVCSKEADIDEMKADVKTIMKLINGNGVIGFGEMARRSFEWMQINKASKNGFIDWTFRTLILVVLAWIGLKP